MNIKRLLNNLRDREISNNNFLHLTVNENQLSKTANAFLNTKLSERYYFGGGENGIVDIGIFTFLGQKEIEDLTVAASDAVKKMTGGKFVNLNCLSGIHAMMCAIITTTEPGDVVMSVKPDDGGHFATEGLITRIGRKHIYASYDLENLRFNVRKTAEDFKRVKAKVLYLDVSNYINSHNLRELREALGEDAIIIYDASHTLGLILGKQFQSPFEEGADIICANTHKTLAGPHKGLVIFKDKELGEKANLIMQSYLYSSVHVNHLIALCVTLLEWEQYGEDYANQVVKNARALAEAFTKLGYEVRRSNNGSYTDNEQVHVFIDKIGDRVNLYKRLVNNNISTNFQNVLGGRTFARLGAQEITRRGMKEDDMVTVADLVNNALLGEDIKEKVIKFNVKFREIHYSFDNQIH